MLISKNLRWNELSDEQKSKSVTEMFEVVERVLFDSKMINSYDEDSYYQDENSAYVQYNTNKTNLVAEISSNSESRKNLVFPISKAFNTGEMVYLSLKDPSKSKNIDPTISRFVAKE